MLKNPPKNLGLSPYPTITKLWLVGSEPLVFRSLQRCLIRFWLVHRFPEGCDEVSTTGCCHHQASLQGWSGPADDAAAWLPPSMILRVLPSQFRQTRESSCSLSGSPEGAFRGQPVRTGFHLESCKDSWCSEAVPRLRWLAWIWLKTLTLTLLQFLPSVYFNTRPYRLYVDSEELESNFTKLTRVLHHIGANRQRINPPYLLWVWSEEELPPLSFG